MIGSPLYPSYTLKTLALLCGVIAVCCLLGAFVQINPVWLWGPYQTWKAISPAQPDWYIGWLEGALRIGPRWAIHFPGHMIPSVFWPGILLPGAVMLGLIAWPWIDRIISRDKRPHHLLDRPRDVPVRTAAGVAFLVFMLGLFFAGADDVVARYTHLPLNDLVWFFRFFCVLGPALAFWITYMLASDLKKKGGTHQAPRVRLRRTPEGGYEEEPV